MGVKVTNNAFGTISAGINSSATTVTLDSGQGARFPTLGGSDHFYGTLIDTSNNVEIIKVTARSTDSMTVVRAQDNTTAQAFAIGDRFELRPTAALFEDILSEGLVIPDNAVTLAKMASGTDGNIISYDASGNPVAVATGSAGQVLTSAGAGAPPTFAAASADVVLLASSGNLTSGSRYNADNVFSSTYKSYKIIGTNLRFSADAPIAFIFRTGGGSGSDSGQSRYNYVHHRVERNSGGVDNAITLTAWQGGVGKITQDTESDDTNKTAGFEFQVFDPNATKSTNFINHSVAWDSSGSWIVNMIGGGTYNYEAALTGIGIYPTSGNYVNGEIKIYGFK